MPTDSSNLGHDLDAEVRAVLKELIRLRWNDSLPEAGGAVGIPQRTLQRVMNEGQGFKLQHVTKFLATLGEDIFWLLSEHPAYKAQRELTEQHRYRESFNRLQRALTADELRNVTRAVETAKRQGIYDQVVALVGSVTHAARATLLRAEAQHSVAKPARAKLAKVKRK